MQYPNVMRSPTIATIQAAGAYEIISPIWTVPCRQFDREVLVDLGIRPDVTLRTSQLAVMPPKKRTRSGNAGGAKKQKTAQGAKTSQPTVPIDEGFKEGGDAHVHIDDDGTIWDASLNLSNVSGNNNKFYMLQLLDDDENNTYHAHNRWGRVGETGQVKTMSFNNLESAKVEYDKKFKSKTGLKWEDRGQEPKDKKYTFVERSYDDDDDKGADAESDEGYGSSGSGKLGKSTLQKGFEQLKELSSLIKHPSLAKNKYNRDREEVIEEWTNKYYSTIPHVFGRDRPPLIDNDDLLRREVAMLDTLTDMEVANTIMNSNSKSKDAASVHKLDAHFQNLKLNELAPLDHSTQEYKEIQNYLIDSSAQQHGLRYRLQDIFRVERPGENERFEKSTKTIKDSRRLLLWHGSRTTNFGGILSQGLRIAPPEAPVNGYAFGKVEAELSNPMYEIKSGDCEAAEKAKKKNCIATKGVGRTGPASWKDASCVNKQLKGVMMPDGKPVDSKDHSGGYLMFNEYISYNVEHLKIRYLLKVAM
ncbi:hypothetical protein NPX13_g3329 [Xylaria arbuscula]|uniref:Poly [ADP-ribose] polymerase n=1 Tax=Xylaria arbuscula TaxID=114810 RepID=A0A9W8TPF5_9PEZI|nr:hypothetical protein NPX13_g3329 [Xylaria arbuscula]